MTKFILVVSVLVGATTTMGYDFNNTKSVYQKNKYGGNEKVGEFKTDYRGNDSYYEKNKYGGYEKTREYRKNYSGGVDIYEKNQYGGFQKVGEIK